MKTMASSSSSSEPHSSFHEPCHSGRRSLMKQCARMIVWLSELFSARLKCPYTWLTALCLMAYWPSFQAQFAFDDQAAIVSNPDVVKTTLRPWHALFHNDYWGTPIKSVSPCPLGTSPSPSKKLTPTSHPLFPFGFYRKKVTNHIGR